MPPIVQPILIQTEADARAMARHLLGTHRIGLDTEFGPDPNYLSEEQQRILREGTPLEQAALYKDDAFKALSFDVYRNQLITVQVGFEDQDSLVGAVFDLGALDEAFLSEILRPVLVDTDRLIILQNGTVEYKQLFFHFTPKAGRRVPFRIGHNLADVMRREQVLYAGTMTRQQARNKKTGERLCDLDGRPLMVSVPLRYGLGPMRVRRLGYDPDIAQEEKDVTRLTFVHGRGQLTEEQVSYGARDAADLLPIYDQQEQEFQQEANRKCIQAAQWENDLIPVIGDLEIRGLPIDVDAWKELAAEADQQVRRLYGELQKVFLPPQYVQAVGETVGSLDRLDLLKMVDPESSKDVLRALKGYGLQPLCPPNRNCDVRGHGWGCVLLESTDEAVLIDYRRTYRLRYGTDSLPPIDLLLEYREWSQRKKTFGWDWLNAVNPITGRVHASFNSYGSKSGRMSASSPNVLQIPSRGPFAKRYRACFRSRRGFKLITADYSQIEMRILAARSGDPVMIDAFQRNADMHSIMAGRILGEDPEVVRKKAKDHSDPDHIRYDTIRNVSKIVSYLQNYGGGPAAASIQTAGVDPNGMGIPGYCDLSRADVEAGTNCGKCARCILTVYRQTYSVATAYLDGQSDFVEEHLYAEDSMGGRRFFTRPDPDATRLRVLEKKPYLTGAALQAVVREELGRQQAALRTEGRNHALQSENARMIKKAARKVWERCRPLGAWIVNIIHDELVVEAPEDKAELVKEIVVQEMESAAQFFIQGVIPTPVEASIADTWQK